MAKVRNINRNRELEERVRQLTERVELANKELESFARAISHDLRSPLQGISGVVELVLEELAENRFENVQDDLRLVLAESRRLTAMVEDLLRFSRVSAKEMSREAVDLTAMAHGIADRIAKGREKLPVVTIQPDLTAFADAGLLQAALEDLLSNACKYSSKVGEPRIDVGELPGDGDMQVFYVRDNGAGFDMSMAHSLFAVFKRLHTSDDFPGTGVGLAIVERIVTRHGGKVWAESSPGAGASFFFSLPRARTDTEQSEDH